MRPRPRLRHIAKWSGVAACLLIAVAFCFTLRWQLIVSIYNRNPSTPFTRGIILWDGTLGYTCGIPAPGPQEPDHLAFECQRAHLSLIWRPTARGTLQSGLFYLPLWIPFLLFAIPTGLLWRADSIIANRARSGQCLKCGYDRRGLTPAAPCPECGKPPPT